MHELFECSKLIGFDFIESEEGSGSAPAREFDGSNFFFGNFIETPILLDKLLLLLLGGVVISVDDEVVLAQHALLAFIDLENPRRIEMNPHKFPQRLLAQEPLSLHVDLPDGFARQTI